MSIPHPLRRALPWLLVAAALACERLHLHPVVIFAAGAAALIPLAGLMGTATGHLAAVLGPGIGGLLNATFGNAAELILAFMALREGHLEIVKASITGSIIGNCLLVLGLSFLAGGLRHPRQVFNTTAAGLGSTLLALSAVSLILPAVFHHLAPSERITEARMSQVLAGILLAAYGLSLIFTLKTHRHLYAASQEGGGHHGDVGPAWSQRRAYATLAVATAGVALVSEVIVSQVGAVTEALRLNDIFVGVVLIAILGNAAEHSSAVIMARRNQLDASLAIAVGSSIQIALFVAPVLVFAGALLGKPLDLVFSVPEVVAVALSAWIVSLVSHDGESHWMEGVLLLAVYTILGVTFYFLP